VESAESVVEAIRMETTKTVIVTDYPGGSIHSVPQLALVIITANPLQLVVMSVTLVPASITISVLR
jgi:hypothetical protein